MDRCPACRGRLGDSPICPRCACDFTHAARAEAQAQSLACRAIQAWTDGHTAMAKACIDKSLGLHRRRLAEAVAAMLRNSANAKDI